jgi:DNA primase
VTAQRNTALTAAQVETYYSQKGISFDGHGDEVRVPCPFHNGDRDSFAVNRRTGDYFCHSECGRGGSIFDFEQKVSSVDAEVARAEVRRIVGLTDSPKRRIVDQYDYTDENGKVLFQSVRLEPKDFSQRQPDGLGGWDWNIKGVRLVPYRLPKIINAETVYICEGEKDVHTLEGFGLVATCNPMGAGKWRDEFAEFLRSKNVVIVPDNDKAGRDHALAVARNVVAVASSVRIVEVKRVDD